MTSGMEYDVLSPESTVTTLLSSSGHLRSGLLPPEHHTSFRYRSKDYDSASAALDAYIADFEGGCQKCRSSTGSIILPRGPASTPSRPRVSTLRNKDVLRESLTERELDFLNLPVSSLRHRSNRERLSMTTDELLDIPYDGSMPVTHTSLQVITDYSDRSLFCDTSTSSHHSLLLLTRCRGRATFKTRDNTFSVSRAAAAAAAASRLAEPTSLHPRLFTWGPSSAPTPTYPSWIQDCDGSEPPLPAESELWHDHVVFFRLPGDCPAAAPRTGAPSWVAELEDDDPDRTRSQVRETNHITFYFYLISAGGNTRAAEVQSVHASGRGLRGSSTRTQPGPVEALKQMLFRLQTLEAKLRPRGGGEEEEEAPAPPDGLKTHQTPFVISDVALHHLGRLKLLVEEEPRKKTGEEKDEDEGRYSSSSADRLSCSQQKPC
uniref:Lung adenoma susceptibility protein 2 n=1 Tax=Scophthalmus maximus TaxID=52904 RepID=A0A8D3DZX2_SCOMX